MLARVAIVPDAVSTLESTKSSVPLPIGVGSPSLVSVTAPCCGFASALCSSARLLSGRLKLTCSGSIWVMVTSGVAVLLLPLLTVTRSPMATLTAPSLPEIGAVMVAKPSWTLSASIVALSASTVAAAAFAAATA